VRPEQRSAHNTSNKNHQTLESKDEPLRTPEHESKKRFTFLTLLVGHLNERYPMPRSVTPFGRGLTLITLALVKFEIEMMDGIPRSYRSRARPAADNWNLIAPSLWG
jgi:hypothetical protein